MESDARRSGSAMVIILGLILVVALVLGIAVLPLSPCPHLRYDLFVLQWDEKGSHPESCGLCRGRCRVPPFVRWKFDYQVNRKP